MNDKHGRFNELIEGTLTSSIQNLCYAVMRDRVISVIGVYEYEGVQRLINTPAGGFKPSDHFNCFGKFYFLTQTNSIAPEMHVVNMDTVDTGMRKIIETWNEVFINPVNVKEQERVTTVMTALVSDIVILEDGIDPVTYKEEVLAELEEFHVSMLKSIN